MKEKPKAKDKPKAASKPKATTRPTPKDEIKVKMQQLVGKAVTDEKFRTLLRDDPVTAGAELGLHFNQAQVDAIKGLHPQIVEAVEAMQKGEYVACGPGVLIPIADVGIVSAFA